MIPDEILVSVSAKQNAESLAYIEEQWGDLYEVIHDRVWAMRPKVNRLDITTTGTATELLRTIRRHYTSTKQDRGRRES